MSSLITEDSNLSSTTATNPPIQFTALKPILDLPQPPQGAPNHILSLLSSKETTLRVISRRQRKANLLIYLVVTDDLTPSPSEIEIRLYVDEDPKLNSCNESVVDAIASIDVGCTVTSFTGIVKYLVEKSCNSNSNSSTNAKKKKMFKYDRTIDCTALTFLPPLHSDGSSVDPFLSTSSSTPTTTTPPTTTSSTNPTILFDINYSSQMNTIEAKSLSRQLTMSYASNRRSPHPFNMVFSGTDLKDPNSELTKSLEKQKWQSWKDIKLIDSELPWEQPQFKETRIVYLTADSPNTLTEINDSTTYIIGGLVDHKDKPFFSYGRATSLGLDTAKLPLEEGFKMLLRANREGLDVTTLSVVQTLLSIREFGPNLPLALFKTPSFHCAPLRKYIKWIGEYEYLNETEGKGAGKPKKPGNGFSLVPAATSIGEEFVSQSRGDDKRLKAKILQDMLDLADIKNAKASTES